MAWTIKTSIKTVISFSFLLVSGQTLSYHLQDELIHGHGVIQGGAFWSTQGHSQQINVNGLMGDYFKVEHRTGNNVLVGAGYFIEGTTFKRAEASINYGLNLFYLPKTSVRGSVFQELLYQNLSFRYDVSHIPLYFVAKSIFNTQFSNKAIIFDVGIGPNLITTSHFSEASLGSNTLPDHIFSGKTTTKFSVTAGLGIKFIHALGVAPVECGYRFFYLGRGYFNSLNTQVLNTLNTGNNYANAVICSIQI